MTVCNAAQVQGPAIVNTHTLIHPLTTLQLRYKGQLLSTHPRNTHPLNTPSQYTLSTHPLNTPSQYTLLIHLSISCSSGAMASYNQHTLVIHTLSIHPLNTPSRYLIAQAQGAAAINTPSHPHNTVRTLTSPSPYSTVPIIPILPNLLTY